MPLADLDPDDYERVSAAFDVAEPLVREIEFENDEMLHETPEERWVRMRAWVAGQIKKETTDAKPTPDDIDHDAAWGADAELGG